MKKVLPFLLLLTVFSPLLRAQIPAGGYTMKGSPVNFDGWQFSPNITSGPSIPGMDEIILVQGMNDIGIINYESTRKLFFCDTTLVEFEFKIEPNANGGADGFAFWILSSMGATPVASPGLGIPINSTGHAVIFDFYDNDNNQNNPIVGSRYFNNQNYTEGSTAGIIGTNQDSLRRNLPNGVWHKVQMFYTFTGATPTNVNLAIYINNTLTWQGIAFNNLPNLNTFFGFSATNGATNFSKISLRDVAIKPMPLPAEILVPTYCTDQLVLPFIYPSGGFSVWYDDYNDNTPSLTAPTVDVSQADTFEYYFAQRKFSNNAYCYGDKMKVVAVVHQSPIVDFDFSKVEGCGADTISFYNLSDVNTADLYFWDFGDGSDTSVFETNHIFAGEGDYRVVLRGQNEFCTDSTAQTIRLENPFEVTFDISRDSICQNGDITFINTSMVTDKNGIPTRYYWDFGTAVWDTLLAQHPPNKFYYQPGEYTIKLVVTNGLPCTDSFTRVLVVDPYPGLTFTRLDTVICQGDDIDFAGTVVSEGLDRLTWDMGDGTFETNITNFTKSYDVPGVYTINALAEYRICPDTSFTRQIKVNGVPNINLPKDTVLCFLGEGFEIQDLLNVNTPAKYTWSTGDTTRSLMIKHHGDYRATVTIDGCSSSDIFHVSKDCYIDIPNAFSPDGDGNNDFFLPRNASKQSIAKFNMQIYNRYGQVIFETKNINGKGWDGKLNDVPQPFGVYVYVVDVTFVNGQTESYNGNVTLIR